MNHLDAKIKDYSINNKKILCDVGFDLNKGEMVVILGANGAGKSSIIKHLSSEIKNENSKIFFNNKLISEYDQVELAQKRAILSQKSEMSFSYSVIDIVLLGRIPYLRNNTFGDEDYLIAKSSLEHVGLLNSLDRDYKTLSGGEQQRVQLARTLTQIGYDLDNKIFLLDEPTNNLDLNYQYQVLSTLKKLSSKGLAVVAILHDLNLASRFADKVLLVKNGNVFSYGVPEIVLTEENIKDVFDHQVIVQKHPRLNHLVIISDY
jgi:iron complex transport system ATP-binding protein